MINMHTKTILVAIALSAHLSMAHAQQQPDVDPAERVRAAMDRAMDMAKRQAAVAPKPNAAKDAELYKRGNPVDPARIAEKYRDLRKSPQEDGPALLVFVSSSMPRLTLKKLGEQIKKAGGTALLRGVVGGLDTPGALTRTLEAMKPLVATGAVLEIDPESFTRYDVGAVPTFLIVDKREDCGSDSCQATTARVVGDVSLDYALSEMERSPGRPGAIAAGLLERMGLR